MDLSIIIVNYNAGEYLRKNINSIMTHIKGLEYEIIVVDNASTDNSLDFLKHSSLPVVLIRNADNLGFSKANNIGIRHSRGKAIILFNQDAWIDNDALSPMYKVITEDHSIGLLGCRIVYPNGRAQTSAYSYTSFGKQFLQAVSRPLRPLLSIMINKFPSLIGGKIIQTHFKNYRPGNDCIDVDYITGACIMFRREMLEKIGLLDETFFMYYEDEDYCRRAKNAGLRVVYMPSVSIIHNLGWAKNKRNTLLINERQRSFRYYCNKYYCNRRVYYYIYAMLSDLFFRLNFILIKINLRKNKGGYPIPEARYD